MAKRSTQKRRTRRRRAKADADDARRGLDRAAAGDPLGPAFETAVEGMAGQSGGNTQFGALSVLTPLAAAASDGRLSPSGVDAVVRGTTVEDAAAFYRAFEHVDVASTTRRRAGTARCPPRE